MDNLVESVESGGGLDFAAVQTETRRIRYCAACGRLATRYGLRGDRAYCHNDGPRPTCYEAASVAPTGHPHAR